MPAITKTLSMRKPCGPPVGFRTSEAPCGMRAMRMRDSMTCGGAGRRRMTAAISSLTTTGTSKAAAMQSTVMSSCVGPMPPVVNT